MPRPDRRSRVASEAWGRRAETAAAWYLRAKGYRILARRVKTKAGEIDLVARHRDTLVFVEVKARTTLDSAILSLHPAARARIDAATRILTPRFAGGCTTIRVDAMLMRPWRWPVHMIAVWREG